MHGFIYNSKTRQRDLNKVSLPNMTSLRLPSPGKAHQKMAVFNYSDFERLYVISEIDGCKYFTLLTKSNNLRM